jgi:DNA-binding NtrC family response regulator
MPLDLHAKPSARVVLIVEDQDDLRALYRLFLENAGLEVVEAASAEQALAYLADREQAPPDAVVLDVMLPGRSGLSLLDELPHHRPGLAAVVTTSSRDVEHAIQALRGGALDYRLKPVDEAELVAAVERAIETTEQRRELAARRALDVEHPVDAGGMLFASGTMRLVLSSLERIKDLSVPVLLVGEPGTGKELSARWIHASSHRRRGPFVVVDCVAEPEATFDDALLASAAGGTLFVDEVTALGAPAQAALARALDDAHAGRARPAALRARLVASSSQDLVAEVEASRFRADLYYRLEVISIALPPLRERREEIAQLAHHVLERFTRDEGLPARQLGQAALEALFRHSWPGNVRELENVLRRAALEAEGDVIEGEHVAFPRPSTTAAPPPSVPKIPRAHEGPLITADQMLTALAETRGNVSAAARRLGIGRSTFYRYAKQFAVPL